jgi:hypothetical protein
MWIKLTNLHSPKLFPAQQLIYVAEMDELVVQKYAQYCLLGHFWQ